MTDITTRKEKEEQLIAGERDYRKALGNLPIAVAITTLEPDAAIVFLNAAFERTLGYTLERNRIHVRHQNTPKACRIEGDDAQLQLALTNLLRNSAEAIAEADCEIREISLNIVTRQKSIVLIIDDSGPGWSGVEKDETPLNTTKPSGSGSGLYVVRTAMKNHHGTIRFGQSPLGGAQVRLRFPKPMEKPSTYTPAPATHAHPNPL